MLNKNCQVLSRNKKRIFRIHFIGVGGIGISALAQWSLRDPRIVFNLLFERNPDKSRDESRTKVFNQNFIFSTESKDKVLVSGSDLESSDVVKDLKKLGAKIKIGPHKTSNLDQKTNLVIYSLAIRPDNPELKKARKLKIKTLNYPEALGTLTKKFYTIAVCGAHGKSTTTAMMALVLIKAGFDPTVVIGTKLKEFGNSNFRIGRSRFLVIEADEYKAAFLNYWPKIIILTNIDREHLDYYKNLRGVIKAFQSFTKRLPKEGGILVINNDDKNSKLQITNNKQILNSKFLPRAKSRGKIQNYSVKHKKDVIRLKKDLKIPGRHNISNALAVLTAARALDIDDTTIFKALSDYKGAWRRFEINNLKIGDFKLKIISDYAHHPTEIKATLQATHEKFPNKRIICVFQPHQEERLKILFNDFVKAFKGVDSLILVESFKVAGREKDKKISNTKRLAGIISQKYNQKVLYAPNPKKAEELIKNNARPGDVILIMGAGDIYKIIQKSNLKNQNDAKRHPGER